MAFTNVLEGLLIICRVGVAGVEGLRAMRDWMADWRKWSPAERALAIALLMSMMAAPLGMLLGLARPGI
ncbi:MAG TPA: hypothetical protein VMB84_18910 [Stellaceae bacterium]|nr:hypothetical protein [Stellaceae bacterium]